MWNPNHDSRRGWVMMGMEALSQVSGGEYGDCGVGGDKVRVKLKCWSIRPSLAAVLAGLASFAASS